MQHGQGCRAVQVARRVGIKHNRIAVALQAESGGRRGGRAQVRVRINPMNFPVVSNRDGDKNNLVAWSQFQIGAESRPHDVRPQRGSQRPDEVVAAQRNGNIIHSHRGRIAVNRNQSRRVLGDGEMQGVDSNHAAPEWRGNIFGVRQRVGEFLAVNRGQWRLRRR